MNQSQTNRAKIGLSFVGGHLFICLCVCICILVLPFSKLLAATENLKIRIMLDPGHGGEDTGTKFKYIKEKTIALKVALRLKDALEKDPDFEVFLTRDKDEFISLSTRSQMAEEKKVALFISIHANNSSSPRAKGTEFYFENQNATDEESMFLANRENNAKDTNGSGTDEKSVDLSNILSDLAHNDHIIMSQQLSQHLLEAFQKNMRIKTRSLRQAPFKVLGVTMPATLIELGFLSNPGEALLLNRPTTQKMMADAIYDGLKTFKEKLDKIHRLTVK